ncbi:hypothetical protein DXG03_005436 [Asterophora parasitica]|uniref:ubiquitinyl hydrolase 1 n=1 Tax=Asterophora parasitica TaxID=117018 RepID=A0A9P7GAE9_9AGAR|nr:hypothetical protein DXG03_005436 [Asterophora parasitica]
MPWPTCVIYPFLSILRSVELRVQSDVTIVPESPLAKFIDECKGKTPLERATHLETTPLFANIHAEAASSGQTSVPTELDTDLHFTCFVRAPAVRPKEDLDSPVRHRVIELDGRREGPVDKGDSEDFLKDVAKIIKNEYLSNASSMNFSVIALGPGST